MSKMKLKLILAGVFVSCALIAWRVAWATPGSGAVITPIAGPVALGQIDIKSHNIKLKTKGLWETRVVNISIAPDGFFGWHTHPGPVFVMVTAGTLTLYHADDPTIGIDYPPGTGFVDPGGGHVHDARNHGGTSVEVVACFLNPQGAPIRIDAPAPTAGHAHDGDDDDDDDDEDDDDEDDD